VSKTLVLLFPHKVVTDALDSSVSYPKLSTKRRMVGIHTQAVIELVESLRRISDHLYLVANKNPDGQIAEMSPWFGDISDFEVIDTGICTDSEEWIEPFTPPDFALYVSQMFGDVFYLGGFHLDNCVSKTAMAAENGGKDVFICPLLTDIGLYITEQNLRNTPLPNLQPWMKPEKLRKSRDEYARELLDSLHQIPDHPARAASV